MSIVLRDGKDPWTGRRYDNAGKVIIEGEFTDVVAGESLEDEVKRLTDNSEQTE